MADKLEYKYEPRQQGKSLAWAMELIRLVREMPDGQEFVLRKERHGVSGKQRPIRD